ncbi:MAG TPA: LiaF-related protein [Exilispira sp.]|nr:LiaF-related protein [Exilispira sp.]
MVKGYSIFNAIFWGLVLVAAGVLLILNYIFKLNIPVFKILIGLILIYIGIYIILGYKGVRIESYNDGKTAVFSDMSIKPEKVESEYNIIFSRGEIDLSGLKEEDIGKHIDISAVFGSAIVKLPSDFSVKVRGSAVFGSVTLPNKQSMGFGDINYSSGESDKFVYIEANAVFGNIVFVK